MKELRHRWSELETKLLRAEENLEYFEQLARRDLDWPGSSVAKRIEDLQSQIEALHAAVDRLGVDVLFEKTELQLDRDRDILIRCNHQPERFISRGSYHRPLPSLTDYDLTPRRRKRRSSGFW